MASFLKTLPGIIDLNGGWLFSINLTCTDEVCVRKAQSCVGSLSSFWIKKVSCMSLAGWSKGKFSAVKLCLSSSICGPFTIVKPMRVKISLICFKTNETGCLAPSSLLSPGSVKSKSAMAFSETLSNFSLYNSIFCSINTLNSFIILPAVFFSSPGRALKISNSSFKIPLRPKNWMRKFSSSSAFFGSKAFISTL